MGQTQPLTGPGPRTAAPRDGWPAPLGLAAATAAAAIEAADADRTGRLSRRAVERLLRAGLARHFVPRRFGGTEGTFDALLTAVTGLGASCSSTAWCGALFAAHGRFAAYLPAAGQRDLWATTPDVPLAAAVAPSGEAHRTGGGWLLRGQWRYVSGIEHAAWALLCATPAGQPAAGTRMFAVPRADITVLDTWDAAGMRATGSHTARVTGALVPDHRSFAFADLIAGTPGPGRAGCHTVPAHLAGGLMFCAPALGAAHRALREATPRPTPAPAQLPHPGEPPAHEGWSRSAGDIAAARGLLRDAARRADAGLRTAPDVARNQRAAAAAATLLAQAVERLPHHDPVHARDASPVLDRCRRDIHTIAGHRVLRHDTAAAAHARA